MVTDNIFFRVAYQLGNGMKRVSCRMRMRQSFCLLVLFVLFWMPSQAQQLRLYTISDPEDVGPKGRKQLFVPDIGSVRIIYHHEVDPDNDGQVNYDVLRQAIVKKIPNRNETGFCILDWEGPQFEYLKFGAIDVDSMNAIVRKFHAMLSYAEKMRPKAKWGIYDMPVSTYWVKQDSLWPKRAAIIQSLVSRCAVLAPCLYDYYQTGSYSWMDDEAYIKMTIERSLQMAEGTNKVVLPFVWHRYHKSTTWKGKHINGLVWWQEDLYYYQIGEPQFLREAAGRDKLAYLDDVILKYLAIIRAAMAGSPLPK